MRIATFNLNNLFDRFNFEGQIETLPAKDRDVVTTFTWEFVGDGDDHELLSAPAAAPVVRIQKGNFGRLVKAKDSQATDAIVARVDGLAADVLAVQEVENITALRAFNNRLADPYPFVVLVEGNDPRLIDVGLLSRVPVGDVVSHRFAVHEERPDQLVFGRDLLEVDLMDAPHGQDQGLGLKVFVNHLKSKFVPSDRRDEADEVQAANTVRRTQQAQLVGRIVERRTENVDHFVVLGDMNDEIDAPALEDLRGELVDGLAEMEADQGPPDASEENSPPDAIGERWSYRLSVANEPDVFSLIDQIWLSAPLAARQTGAGVHRRRAWTTAARGVGSDHDPVFVDVDLDL